MKIAIIGAGLSGSNIYSKLKKDGHDVTLFEKSRGSGGRCSTRYINDNKINHGTSSFTIKKDDFKKFCDEKINENILLKNETNYYALDGMNKLCSSLIDMKDLIKNTKITSCTFRNKKWILRDENRISYEGFDKLILSIPAAQILELDINITIQIQKQLEKVKYDSIATLIVYSHSLEKINNKALLQSKNFHKIIDNSIQKNNKNFSCYIFHLNQELTNKQNFEDKEMIKKYILNKIYDESGLCLEDNFHVFPHFWKYALVLEKLNQDYIYDENLGLGICGDYFNGNNLESAFLSSKRLYEDKFR